MRVADIDNKNQNPMAGKAPPGGIDRSADNSLTISIVIPVHNGGEKFRRCLETVNALQPAPLELIVVCDGDTDGSADGRDISYAGFNFRFNLGLEDKYRALFEPADPIGGVSVSAGPCPSCPCLPSSCWP